MFRFAPMSASQTNHKAILVVEDDDLLRELIVELFRGEGFEVLAAENAKQALQQLEVASDIRLLLTDVNMPGELDGVGLVQLVRQRWPQIASIVSSGRMRPRSEELPPKVRFVPKPWRVSDMLREANDLLLA
jgi:two-component system, response regulator PdtaR